MEPGIDTDVGTANTPQILGLAAVRVFVSDLNQALEFYTGPLGLQPSGSDDRSWVLFRLSNALLLVESVDAESDDFPELVGRFTGMSFDTPDIHATFERLSSAGVRFLGRPEKQHWGGWLSHFGDPDDNILTLVG